MRFLDSNSYLVRLDKLPSCNDHWIPLKQQKHKACNSSLVLSFFSLSAVSIWNMLLFNKGIYATTWLMIYQWALISQAMESFSKKWLN